MEQYVRPSSPQSFSERKEQSKNKSCKVITTGCGLIGIISIVVVSVFVVMNLQNNDEKTSTSNGTHSSDTAAQTDRKTGNAELVDGEVDAEVYEKTIVGRTIGLDGGVLSLELQGGGDAYLIVPSNILNGSNVELSEFSELPTSDNHLPMYTDYGYGVNIWFEDVSWGLDKPAYLVFDFSNGESLKDFQSLADTVNYCDYSTTLFNPVVCASLLNLPLENTMNTKLLAAAPQYADDGRTPTFAQHSYFIGKDDVLVVGVMNSSIIIPQPHTEALAEDIVASTFGRYSADLEEREAYDIMRYHNMKISDKDLLLEIFSTYLVYDVKTYFAQDYVYSLYDDAVDSGLIDTNEVLSPREIVETFLLGDSELEVIFQNLPVGYDANMTSVENVANLRRAYDSEAEGSAQIALNTLEDLETNLTDQTYAEHEVVYALIAEGILIGKGKYERASEILGESDDRNEFEAEAADAQESWPDHVNDAYGNATNVISDLAEWMQLAQLLGDDELADLLQELIEDAVRDAMENAESDDEIIQAAQLCQAVLDDSECEDILEKAKDALLRLCEVEVESKNLSNFAVQTELLKCKQLVGKD